MQPLPPLAVSTQAERLGASVDEGAHREAVPVHQSSDQRLISAIDSLPSHRNAHRLLVHGSASRGPAPAEVVVRQQQPEDGEDVALRLARRVRRPRPPQTDDLQLMY